MTATKHAALLLFALAAAPAAALADDVVHDPIAAEALFERGKQMMDDGRTEEACRAFADSQRLDPAGGTLLRLALCHEKLGKLASARFEFHEVIRVSREGKGDPAKLAERIRIAQERLASVEPRVPRLVVSVPDESRMPSLAVTLNGLSRTEATWGVAIPTDPGDIVVVATAPSRRAFQTTVHLGEGDFKTVNIPPLEGGPPVTPPPPPYTADTKPVSSPQRPIGVFVGIAGLATIGVGSYFGARAISKWHDANGLCPGTACDATAVSLADDAKNSARVADVTIAAGAVAVIVGIVMWATGAPKQVRVGVGSVGVTF